MIMASLTSRRHGLVDQGYDKLAAKIDASVDVRDHLDRGGCIDYGFANPWRERPLSQDHRLDGPEPHRRRGDADDRNACLAVPPVVTIEADGYPRYGHVAPARAGL